MLERRYILMYDPCNVYRGRYKEFIESVKLSRLLNEKIDGSEEHHIIPKCTVRVDEISIIDTEDYKIYLLYREHFIAHRILAEDNPNNRKLAHAFWRMCNNGKYCTPEDYELGRKLFVESMKGNQINVGRIHSQEVRDNKSEFFKNLPRTEDHKQHISDSLKKSWELREDHSRSLESRRKQSIAVTGSRNHRYGKTLVYVNNGEVNKMVSPDNLQDYLDQGFVKGMIRPLFNVTCKICGKSFNAKSGRAKYCLDCKI